MNFITCFSKQTEPQSIPLRSETRQGRPLCSLPFSVSLEVIARTIKQGNKRNKNKKSNQEYFHLQIIWLYTEKIKRPQRHHESKCSELIKCLWQSVRIQNYHKNLGPSYAPMTSMLTKKVHISPVHNSTAQNKVLRSKPDQGNEILLQQIFMTLKKETEEDIRRWKNFHAHEL